MEGTARAAVYLINMTESTADLSLAFDALQKWIEAAPSLRSCWVIDRMHGKWRVGLQSGDERYTASQDAELRGAVRNALAIAKMAGCL